MQIWAESFEARFTIPLVGNVTTLAYYLEAKYQLTPRFSGALRWNQQDFSRVRTGSGAVLPWGNDVWRVDAAGTYRFTAHTEIKLQASLQHDAIPPPAFARLLAVQFVIRF